MHKERKHYPSILPNSHDVPWGLSPALKNFSPYPNLFKPQGFPRSQIRSIQLEKSNMFARTQSSGACKQYDEMPLFGEEEKHVVMYMAINTAP